MWCIHIYASPEKNTLKVDKRSELSFEEFYNTYDLGKKPVVITGYEKIMTPTKFTLDHIKKMCGKKKVFAEFRVEGSSI